MARSVFFASFTRGASRAWRMTSCGVPRPADACPSPRGGMGRDARSTCSGLRSQLGGRRTLKCELSARCTSIAGEVWIPVVLRKEVSGS
jgi:hypothetical protein